MGLFYYSSDNGADYTISAQREKSDRCLGYVGVTSQNGKSYAKNGLFHAQCDVQLRVLIWIDGHIPSRVMEFFLTDWIQENAMNGQRIG